MASKPDDIGSSAKKEDEAAKVEEKEPLADVEDVPDPDEDDLDDLDGMCRQAISTVIQVITLY